MRRLRLLILLGIAVCARPTTAGEENLLPNGSFESGLVGWRFDDGQPRSESKGRAEIVRDHVRHGQAAFLLEKTVTSPWLPELSCQPIAITPGGYYQATAMVDSAQPLVFRCIIGRNGGNMQRGGFLPPTEGWEQIAIPFHAPPDARSASLSLLIPRRTGRMWIDDVQLRTVTAFDDTVETLRSGADKAGTIQRLDELARRTRIKPYDLLRSPQGDYPSERLVFRDAATGTVLWKMARNPGYNRHTYSNVPVWNADGSRLLLRSLRPAPSLWWLLPADGTRWACFAQDFVYWSPVDPRKTYGMDRSTAKISETDILTGQTRLLWQLPQENLRNYKLLTPSHDAKKLLVREKGVQVNGKSHSFAWLLNADGSGRAERFDLGREAGQTWFLKRDDYSFTFNDQPGAGEANENHQWVCEPLRNGALRLLDPFDLFSHVGVSPSGKRAAHFRNGGIWVTDVDTGKSRLCVPGDGGHLSWECDDGWFVASMGNAIAEVQAADGRARLICVPNTQHSKRTECEPESSPDGTKIGYASTMLGDCDFYVALQRLPDPPRNVRREGRVLTWDPPEHCRELAGYGIYRGSELLNRELLRQCRYDLPAGDGAYTVVAVEHSGLQSPCPDREPPPAPTGLAGAARSPYAVELTWQASRADDVSYYNVYCSPKPPPAPVQENRVASPSETRVLDWGLQAGTAYHYAVTAVDRLGNEGPPCAPVVVQTPAVRRVLQRVAIGKPLSQEPVTVSLQTPQDDRYLLWGELKAGRVKAEQWIRVHLDGARPLIWRPMWDFVCIAHDDPEPIPFFDLLKSDGQCDPWFTLKAGAHQLDLALPAGSAEIVSVILTNDAGFVPEGATSFRNVQRPAR